MNDFLHSPLPDEEDEKLLDELDLEEAFSDPEQRFHMSDSEEGTGKNRVLLLCVIVSLLIHFGLVLAIPRFIAAPNHPAPGPNVMTVRPVELPPATKPEPPPENPSAISNQNHRAEQERIPRFGQASPIGEPEPMNKQLASLTPPIAPDVDKPIEEQKSKQKPETKRKEEPPKKTDKPKPQPSELKEPAKPRPDQPKPIAKRTQSQRKKPQLADLMPTADDYATAFGAPGGVQDFDPRGDPDEAVVDLNAKEDNKYYSYLLYLKQKIQGVWDYPRAAQQSGTGGSLIVEFSIAKDGKLLFVKLLDSSGHTILDDSAMNAIHSAAPYMPLPDRLGAKRLRIRAQFIYVTRKFLGRLM